jgi:hypothetical protein
MEKVKQGKKKICGIYQIKMLNLCQSLLHAVSDMRNRYGLTADHLAACVAQARVIFTWAAGWTSLTALWLFIEVVWTILPVNCRTEWCPTLT